MPAPNVSIGCSMMFKVRVKFGACEDNWGSSSSQNGIIIYARTKQQHKSILVEINEFVKILRSFRINNN